MSSPANPRGRSPLRTFSKIRRSCKASARKRLWTCSRRSHLRSCLKPRRKHSSLPHRPPLISRSAARARPSTLTKRLGSPAMVPRARICGSHKASPQQIRLSRPWRDKTWTSSQMSTSPVPMMDRILFLKRSNMITPPEHTSRISKKCRRSCNHKGAWLKNLSCHQLTFRSQKKPLTEQTSQR